MRSVMPLPFLPILFLCFTSAAETIRPLDTTQPNEFYFTQDVYYVDEDATNAVITVGFRPGDSGFSGNINYFTADGTAIAGEDYAAVSGTLYFSGPAPRTFNIPIKLDGITESNETVQLYLSNPNAFISRSNATLVIIDKPAHPRLDIITGANSITVSWPTNCIGFSLERSTGLTDNSWSQVSTPANQTNGNFTVIETVSSNCFYRLTYAHTQ